ncbi:hypothetical protein BH10PSE17_BH10PSE17_11740 [soil metagenome]
MTLPPPRALVFMTGRNCQQYVARAIASVARQTLAGIHVLFVDDVSSDGTEQVARTELESRFPGRHTLLSNQTQWGKARNAHVHLRSALHHGDFVAVLDADDELIIDDVLEQMSHAYATGSDVVWTNFEIDDGRIGVNGPLDPFRSPRAQGWRTSHLFSFRAELFAQVGEDRFKDEQGEWLMAACDFAIAYPILDQTRRYRFLPILAHRYTATNPKSHHNADAQASGLNSRAQQASARVVLSKPALPCTRWVFGQQAAADRTMASVVEGVGQALATLTRQLAHATEQQAAPSAAAQWAGAAGRLLAQDCPALVDLALDTRSDPLDVETTWRWWRWLKCGPDNPSVLEVGTGPLSPTLHALVRALGGRVVSVSGEADQASALRDRLARASIDAEVLHLPLVGASFEGFEGKLPDLGALPPGLTGFDLVVVSASHAGPTAADSALALPMAIGRVRHDRFRFCLWAPDQTTVLAMVTELWRSAAPDLAYTAALGGAALVVQPPIEQVGRTAGQ